MIDIDLIKIHPGFIDMCFSDLAGNPTSRDLIAGSDTAIKADLLRIDRLAKANGHFLNSVMQSRVFNMNVDKCVLFLRSAGDGEAFRANLSTFTAQAMLLGMQLHAQLLEKQKAGLI